MYLYVPHLVIDSNEIMKTLKKKAFWLKKKNREDTNNPVLMKK